MSTENQNNSWIGRAAESASPQIKSATPSNSIPSTVTMEAAMAAAAQVAQGAQNSGSSGSQGSSDTGKSGS
jgi:hypothetical protein